MPEQPITWTRSSFCSNAGCVEIARQGDLVLLRSSELTDRAPLELSLADARAFVAGVKADEFDSLLED